MEPGRASHQPPPFPDHWCGLWKDPYGKLMYIRREHGRQVSVSFTAGLRQPFYPVSFHPNGKTAHIPGLYQIDAYGAPVMQVDIGTEGYGPRIDFHFIFGEGDRLRNAEPWDIVSGVIARPRLILGMVGEEQANAELAWARQLGNCWKADEDEEQFLAGVGWR